MESCAGWLMLAMPEIAQGKTTGSQDGRSPGAAGHQAGLGLRSSWGCAFENVTFCAISTEC